MSKPGYVEQSFWIRLVFMLFYWVVLNVALSLFGLLILVVTLWRFGSQHKPDALSQFQFTLTGFIVQILDFLTFKTEEKPYPFQLWPRVNKND